MKKQKAVLILVVALSVTLPYILAALLAGRNLVFTGFLLNPFDGASYLAKMQQGYSGAWRFTLPFTVNPGNGAYLFLYYMFLGHLARWTGVSLLVVYHLARLLGAAALLLAMFQFYECVFPNRPGSYWAACWLTAFGAGMGWLVVFFGLLPSDFWVAEAYPFLSMYANPHFPLGLALILWSFSALMDHERPYRNIRLLLAGLLLSIILPFGIVLVMLVAFGWLVWTWLETRQFHWQPVLSLGAFGGPFVLYQFWAALTDPVLAGWNTQNLTPSPPPWDFLLSFSPGLLLALPGVFWLLQCKEIPVRRILVTWLAMGLLLVYFPFSLQRRFMLGLYIPVAGLAIYGIDYFQQKAARFSDKLWPILLGLSLPSTVLLVVIGLFGALGHSPLLYLTKDEARALTWIRQSTPSQAVVLAAPELARWIPGWTGRRVVYGHPFETVDAKQNEAWVLSMFEKSDSVNQSELAAKKVDVLVYGPRERELNPNLNVSALPLLYHSGNVRLYAVEAGH